MYVCISDPTMECRGVEFALWEDFSKVVNGWVRLALLHVSAPLASTTRLLLQRVPYSMEGVCETLLVVGRSKLTGMV